MAQQEEEHLYPEEIRYLALEGGGGKGFAYLGAVQVLEELGVMKNIRGIAGTSAGAITAMMLSIHMTAKDIEKELLNEDFNKFFDPPLNREGKRLVPMPFEYKAVEDDLIEKALLDPKTGLIKALACLKANDSKLARVLGGLAWLLRDPGIVGTRLRGLLSTIGSLLPVLMKDEAPLLLTLIQGLPHYLVYFDRDMGLFSGKAARDYFDVLLRKAAARITGDAGYADPRSTRSMTFIVHKAVFKTDLLICGANLSTGKSVLFSHKHTPQFPVADAVRISMSLPGFKPYVIRRRVVGWPPCGTYVDGGVWNNLPFREIGSMASLPTTTRGTQETLSSFAILSERRSTLGLRLEIVDPMPVLRGEDIMGQFLKLGLTAGEAQVIADIEPFTLLLNTEGLDTLVFKPPKPVQAAVTKLSRQKTYRYFGKSPPEDGPVTPEMLKQQEEIDRQTRERRESKVCL
jgi:NTE family protein